MPKSPASNEDSEAPPTKRTRSAVACSRCKSRRQKCDNLEPTCSNCAKSSKECTYSDGDYPSWYTQRIEAKVVALEAQLRQFQQQQTMPTFSSDLQVKNPSSSASASSSSYSSAPPQLPSFQPNGLKQQRNSTSTFASNHLGSALGFLSLCATAEPYYLGSTSGFSLANMVQAAVSQSSPNESSISPIATSNSPADALSLNLPSPADQPFSCHRPKETTQPAALPSDDLGDILLNAYLSKVHRPYPFLDRSKLIACHRDRHSLSQERGGDMVLLKLHLVYGIGARHLQLSSSTSHGVQFDRTLPEAHFVAAIQKLETAFQLRGMDTVESLLLLTLYSLHAPSGGPGVYHLIGMATRSCVEMGLHREAKQLPSGMEGADQLRKRLFWSTYLLERKIANTLGRPFSLSDEDIDVELPLELLGTAQPGQSETCHFVKLVKLERINSKIQRLSSRINDSFNPPSLEEVELLRLELETWFSASQSSISSSADLDESIALEYYKSLRFLYQPFVLNPHPSQQFVLACAQASGSICKSYKRLHVVSISVGMFVLELQDVLVAGISLIFCVWLYPKLVDPFNLMDDLNACSTVLFIISERWASGKRYRDSFEALVAKTMAHVKAVHQVSGDAGPQEQLPGLQVPFDLAETDHNILGYGAAWGTGDDLWAMLNTMTGTSEGNAGIGFDDLWLNDAMMSTTNSYQY